MSNNYSNQNVNQNQIINKRHKSLLESQVKYFILSIIENQRFKITSKYIRSSIA
jgi:hypothetical protein